MQHGWVKLHRALLNSDTFSKLNAIQKLIAIYIILNANHEDGTWYDSYKNIEVEIKRGQLVTSRNTIVNEWFKGDKDVTDRKVRTTLEKLRKLGFLTIETTKHYTLLTVCNYSVYQQREIKSDQQNDQQTSNECPTDDQKPSLNKKNLRINKNTSPKQQAYDESSIYFQLANYLFSKILILNPNHKKPDLQKWSNSFRLMMEKDNRTVEQIRYTIDFANNDPFWSTVVLSPDKLRKQFDSIVIKIKSEKKKTNATPTEKPEMQGAGDIANLLAQYEQEARG